jgi:hypothetical protein
MDLDSSTMDVDMSVFFETVPLGEEGLEMSHEGGEFEAFEDLAQGTAGISG